MQEELEKPAAGFLGLLQRLIYMDDYDSASLRDRHEGDSWLGRALDMERRTAKIVSMAETNIESTVEGKIDELKTAQQGIQENVAVIMQQLKDVQNTLRLAGADTQRSVAPAPAAENPKKKK